jgi:hypothetical protein
MFLNMGQIQHTPGTGTRFTITLPIAPEEVAEPA